MNTSKSDTNLSEAVESSDRSMSEPDVMLEEEDEEDDDDSCNPEDEKDDDDDWDNNLSPKQTLTPNDPRAEVYRLSQTETRRVRFWRLVVLLLLAITGALVATGTYLLLRNAQEDDFRNQYYMYATTISDAAQFHLENMHQAVKSLGETITTSALYSITPELDFPFVTVPAWELYACHARQQAGLEGIAYTPIVTTANLANWSNYSVSNQNWIQQSRQIMLELSNDTQAGLGNHYVNTSILPMIYETTATGTEPVTGPGPFLPIWQSSPPPFDPQFINFDTMTRTSIKGIYPIVSLSRDAVFSDVHDLSAVSNSGVSSKDHVSLHHTYGSNVTADSAWEQPHSIFMSPVFSRLNNPGAPVVGFLQSIVAWDRLVTDLLPKGVEGIYAVLSNTCGQSYTYVVRGQVADYAGWGDVHEGDFSDLAVQVPLYKNLIPNSTHRVEGHCEYTITTYPSANYKANAMANTPVIYTAIVAVVFFLIVVIFLVYDCFVSKRNQVVVLAAARSNAIISSLFPQNVRDRLFAEKSEEEAAASHESTPTDSEILGYEGKPIADLFTDCTILFADIAGFTAWSSVREPAQVFTLLETLYKAFDEIARRRRVFKVETVGDCYVAVTGLPNPRKDHAVAMVRFARDCMSRTKKLVKKLEVSLGPDTGDLSIRMGIHSGPVTAGVLRGERSRFQLFGDTMNTASRMESTGQRGRIQLSQETADLLIAAGKVEWVTLRDDKVHAKGKGELQTYWLNVARNRSDSTSSAGDSSEAGTEVDDADKPKDETFPVPKLFSMSNSKMTRLVEWNVDVLLRLLKQLVAMRRACGIPEMGSPKLEQEIHFGANGEKVIDEVKEIIELPQFNAKAVSKIHTEAVTLPVQVVDQMYDYVSNIAALYNDNPFHNFEHASHVTMSVVKLLSRIVAPSDVLDCDDTGKQQLHDHTYGITSDPLTQFACVFSALIHDADHSGVPNAQLINEQCALAKFYQAQSVAEQNSVDLCWQLLMDKSYQDLRHTIYSTTSECKRFRQLVVNSVMATDIVDKNLKALRNARWTKAFSMDQPGSKDITDTTNRIPTRRADRQSINRKATIVIEHLIQASDVAHTMQHWHIYRKWNERFFLECYQAYKEGRASKDPSEGWYEGELGFYDYYIIPLAKKLKDCGVFGVSSDEYLNYAQKNRREWEMRGREVVDEMMEVVHSKIGAKEPMPAAPTTTVPETRSEGARTA